MGATDAKTANAAPMVRRPLAAAARATLAGGARAARGLLDALLPPHCLTCEAAVGCGGSGLVAHGVPHKHDLLLLVFVLRSRSLGLQWQGRGLCVSVHPPKG